MDPNSSTGMIRYAGADDPHVTLEFTGYTIRKFLCGGVPDGNVDSKSLPTVEVQVQRWPNARWLRFLLERTPFRGLLLKKVTMLVRKPDL